MPDTASQTSGGSEDIGMLSGYTGQRISFIAGRKAGGGTGM